MNFIEIENKHYILASSALADQKTIVLKEGDTFALFEVHGDVYQVPSGSHGIYHNGMRYLSKMQLTLNGLKPLLLSSFPREDNQMIIVDLTNPDLSLQNTDAVLRGTIHILRSKFLWQGAYHEKISFINFGLEPLTFSVELNYDADFADIFEVRGTPRQKKGERLQTQKSESGLTFAYKGLDNVIRETKIDLDPKPASVTQHVVRYQLSMNPKDEVAIDITTTFIERDEKKEVLGFDAAKNAMNTYLDKVRDYCAGILTSNDQFNQWINRSKNDLITMTTRTPHGSYPYAGIPWYSTPFGRDGILTAFECLWVEPELARGVLHYLAQTQAKDFNDFQDAEPGKIFHETRGGEMAELGEIPFKLYYGTIDATPLFVCLAGAYLERTNDLETLKQIWPNIEKALYWIDNYGDIDGDGFVEYKTKSSKGLTNQGWKDSFDSIFHDSGKLADEPIALCEVQGYVYDAKVSAAAIAKALGIDDASEELKHQAEQLKDNFNKQFWSDAKQVYVLALDGKKHTCDVISSNAGHCLFSGIATPERARLTAKNLLNENMFSGWGIRTIAMSEARYNPMSYHNGSIWPHDNAIIAYGFSRYNLMDEAAKVLKGVFDTAIHSDDYRLPELFCGFDRIKGQGPTSYPVACAPQAWSVGAIFMLIQSCLGMRIKAAENTISFCQPVLPAFLKEITISNLRINDQRVILQIRKMEEGIDVSLLNGTGIKIELNNTPVLEVDGLVQNHLSSVGIK
jgi:glycogen debranching enzyme